MKVSCLRCNAEVKDYQFTRATFLPYGAKHSHVMLECPRCGHVEFLTSDSPLLKNLQAVPTFAGDGD